MPHFLYEILFPNGKRYIGITDNFPRRWYEHKQDSRGPGKLRVSRALRKYGHENVCAKIILIGDRSYIIEMEIKAIAAYRATEREFGYNVSLGGFLPSEETKAKFRANSIALWKNEDFRKRVIEKKRGHKLPGVSFANRNRSVLSPEQVAALHNNTTMSTCELARNMGVNQNRAMGAKSRRTWKDWPTIVDRDALTQHFGPLGQFLDRNDMDAAVYRYMRQHQGTFTVTPTRTEIPGVFFENVPESRIR